MTAGIRPWALSLAEILHPVHSLGMAWMVWYAAAGGDDEREEDLAFNTAVLRRPASPPHHLDVVGVCKCVHSPDFRRVL